MTATTLTTKLAKEIHEEFLVCKICFDVYKNPKCLSCMHTFCAQCIENHIMAEVTYKKYCEYRDFTCPLCRKRTQLPVGGVRKLSDNLLVSSLSEVVSRQKPSAYPICDLCKSLADRQRDATSKCIDCCKLLCASCTTQHKQMKVTSTHSLIDAEIQKDIECKEHPDEVVRFYCEPCQACICILCTFNDHKEHDVTQFGEAVDKYKGHIMQLLDSCRAKIIRFDANIKAVARSEENFREAEQKIHDNAMKFLQEVRVRERQLVEELRNAYGPEYMDYIDNRKDLTFQMENLRNTCNLTDHILSGKSIELLLLKNDIEEKLNILGDVVVKDVPEASNKVIEYVSGTVDLGHISDEGEDQPSGGRVKHRRSGSEEKLDAVKEAITQQQSKQTSKQFTNRNEELDHMAKLVLAACQKPAAQTVTQSTQTEQRGMTTVSRAIQTDDLPAPTPPPTQSRVQSFFRRPESNVYSKPARYG